MLVAGLDIARRRDHSALVFLDVGPARLLVTAALRLPQAPLREQFALIAPHLAVDLLVFDQSGLGPSNSCPRLRRVSACASSAAIVPSRGPPVATGSSSASSGWSSALVPPCAVAISRWPSRRPAA